MSLNSRTLQGIADLDIICILKSWLCTNKRPNPSPNSLAELVPWKRISLFPWQGIKNPRSIDEGEGKGGGSSVA